MADISYPAKNMKKMEQIEVKEAPSIQSSWYWYCSDSGISVISPYFLSMIWFKTDVVRYMNVIK